MSRESKPPTYRKQIGRNGARAFVELGERRVYLGPYNSKESRERYTRALAEWESSGGHLAVPANQLTIVELVARFCTFCEGYYVKADGRVTAEVESVRTAMRPLLSLYARCPWH
ncbi:MAG: hypothetical protein IID35_12680 [Planctomycetes bacterium]|nr:hypothetical protein [Planctomycetota bacterium]